MTAFVTHAVERLDAARQNDLRKLAQLLGDPQADIRCARNDGGIGMFRRKPGQRIGRGGPRHKAFARTDEDIRAIIERGDLTGRFRGTLRPGVRCRSGAALDRRVDDRTVAGAAAEIAGHMGGDLGTGRRAARLVEREQRHDEARRTETALRAVRINQRLLYGVKNAIRRQIVHGDEFLAVELHDKQDAGVDRLIGDTAVLQASECHGAGAAIALVAAFLGAARPLFQPQIVQYGAHRRHVMQFDDVAAAEKTDGGTGGHRRLSSRDRSNSHRERAAAAHDNAPIDPRCRSGWG